jgi:hypothetical protein
MTWAKTRWPPTLYWSKQDGKRVPYETTRAIYHAISMLILNQHQHYRMSLVNLKQLLSVPVSSPMSNWPETSSYRVTFRFTPYSSTSNTGIFFLQLSFVTRSCSPSPERSWKQIWKVQCPQCKDRPMMSHEHFGLHFLMHAAYYHGVLTNRKCSMFSQTY